MISSVFFPFSGCKDTKKSKIIKQIFPERIHSNDEHYLVFSRSSLNLFFPVNRFLNRLELLEITQFINPIPSRKRMIHFAPRNDVPDDGFLS